MCLYTLSTLLVTIHLPKIRQDSSALKQHYPNITGSFGLAVNLYSINRGIFEIFFFDRLSFAFNAIHSHLNNSYLLVLSEYFQQQIR